jgi:hypothetical protein
MIVSDLVNLAALLDDTKRIALVLPASLTGWRPLPRLRQRSSDPQRPR